MCNVISVNRKIFVFDKSLFFSISNFGCWWNLNSSPVMVNRNLCIGILVGFTLSSFVNLILLHSGVEPDSDFPELSTLYPKDYKLQTISLYNEPKNFTWSILTTFLPSKAYPDRYKLGFTTWMALEPKPELIFLSDGNELEILHEMAFEFNASVYPVKTNLRGTPLV
jgi:hypothetical protein